MPAQNCNKNEHKYKSPGDIFWLLAKHWHFTDYEHKMNVRLIADVS